MAAISSALLGALKAEDELISTAQLYGGTYRLMRDVFPDMGIKVHHVEADLAGIEKLVTRKTKVLYVETPTNPTLRLVDLNKAIAFAKNHNLISIVDNTFATPVLQQPLSMGYDMVVHSATKYLGGHSDLIAGAAAGSKHWMDRVRHMVICLGGSMDPETAYLLIRGMKTLGLRVQEQGRAAASGRRSRDGARLCGSGGRRRPYRGPRAGAGLVLSKDQRHSTGKTQPSWHKDSSHICAESTRGAGDCPLLFLREQRLDDIFQFVRAANVLRIIIDLDIKSQPTFGADIAKFLRQPDGDAVGVLRLRLRKNESEQVRGEAIDGIGGPQLS